MFFFNLLYNYRGIHESVLEMSSQLCTIYALSIYSSAHKQLPNPFVNSSVLNKVFSPQLVGNAESQKIITPFKVVKT